MLQTDRKTEQTRQTAQEKKDSAQRKQNLELPAQAALALEAILGGGSWEQLPTDGVLALSHTLGNAALAELASARTAEPETVMAPLPRSGCETAPMRSDGGMPLLAQTPSFGAMGTTGTAAPLAV